MRLTRDPKGSPPANPLAGVFPFRISSVIIISVYTDVVLFVSRVNKSLNKNSQTITKVPLADISIDIVIPS